MRALVTHDDRAAVVLQRGGDDLRGRGAHLVYHYHQRPVINRRNFVRRKLIDIAVVAADLHHRLLLVDEQSGQVDRLVQQAAAVVAEVENHARDALLLQVLQQRGHVSRGILVEIMQVDHAEFLNLSVGILVLDDVRLGQALLNAHHVALEDDVRLRRTRGRARRGNHQVHHRTLAAANHVHHAIQLHVHRVDRLRVALAHRHDLVAGLQALVEVRRPARDDLINRRVTVHRLEHRADAGHGMVDRLDAEILRLIGLEIIRVRVIRMRQRAQPDLEDVHVVLLDALAQPRNVAPRQRIGSLRRGLLVEQAVEQVRLHLQPPCRLRLGLVFEPCRLLRAHRVGLVLGEIVVVMQQPFRIAHVLVHALQVAVENVKGRRHHRFVVVAVDHELAEAISVLRRELVDVALQEEKVRRVEREEVVLQPALRHLRRDRRLQVVIVLQQLAYDMADFCVAIIVHVDRLERWKFNRLLGDRIGRRCGSSRRRRRGLGIRRVLFLACASGGQGSRIRRLRCGCGRGHVGRRSNRICRRGNRCGSRDGRGHGFIVAMENKRHGKEQGRREHREAEVKRLQFR